MDGSSPAIHTDAAPTGVLNQPVCLFLSTSYFKVPVRFIKHGPTRGFVFLPKLATTILMCVPGLEPGFHPSKLGPLFTVLNQHIK